MKKIVVFFIVALSIVAFSTKLVLWTAPNPLQEEFWKTILEEWKSVRPDIEIEWSVIPAAGSSEEAILTAIAAGKAPDICTNIFSGFGAQLANLGVLHPLDSFGDAFWSLLDARKSRNIAEKWKMQDHYYVLPIYSNPILIWWRGDLLKELGYDKPPRTYGDIYEISEKFVIPNERYGMQVIAGRNWWDRWFDFIMFYYAASEGQAYIDTEKRKAIFNNEYGEMVAEFIYKMFENGWTAVDLGTNPLYMGAVLGKNTGPWEINWARETFPDVIDSMWFSMPPVPDDYPEDTPIYTFADTKGLVMFETCKDKQAAFEFISWVFSNVEHDVLWTDITRMPPAREDLGVNPQFSEFMKDRFFKAYADAVPYAIPPALIDKTIDVQIAMTTYLVEPLMHLKKTPQEALPKAVKEVNKILF